MAHYAFINKNNIVVEVITGVDESEVVDEISDWEDFYTTQREGLRALRTSYNTLAGQHLLGGQPFRGNYAGIGFFYDENLDAFIPPKPFASWILDKATYSWVAPIQQPSDGKVYIWDEMSASWVKKI